MASKEAKRIFDLVDCIQGTYVDTIKEGVTADKNNIQNPCRIEYIPDKPAFSGFKDMVSWYFGRGSTVITNRVYPQEAVMHFTLDETSEEGVPKRVVVITEDQNRHQTFLDKVHDKFQESITKMAENLSEEQKSRMEKEIQNLEQKEKDKQDQKSNSRSRKRGRDRGRGGGESIEDMF